MKLKTRIILVFTMIILMPLLLFAATLYGFSQSQAQKAQAARFAAALNGAGALTLVQAAVQALATHHRLLECCAAAQRE